MGRKIEAKSMVTLLLLLVSLVSASFALNTPSVQSNAVDDSVTIYKELTQLSTGNSEEAPSIFFDHNDNLHIAWIGNDTANLYYMMVDRLGNVLINETCLDPNPNATTNHVRRVSIAGDSSNNVHIVFHAEYVYEPWPLYTTSTLLSAHEVLYLKLDPYLDDLDGSAANYVDITVIPETIISTDDGNKSRAANVAVDSIDNVHVAWFDNNLRYTMDPMGELHYLVMDVMGGIVVPETNVTGGFWTDVDWSEPEIVVDSQGDAHVFFVTRGWNGSWAPWRDIWYTMIDGGTGNTLINSTQLTDSNETWKHSRPFVDIDAHDNIHVAWHDSRFDANVTGEHEIFYMKMDPYLDDRNGDSADPGTIIVLDEMLISENDYLKSFLVNIDVDQHGMAHLVWINAWDWDYVDIYYALVNATGAIIVPEYRITHTNETLNFAEWFWSSNRNPEIAVNDGQIFIVDMAYDLINWTYDVWLTIAFIDVIPPTIGPPTRDPSGDVDEGQPVKISVEVTDAESGVDKDQVILSFTFDNGASWFYTKMSYNSTSGFYEAVIPSQFNCTWVDYMISASDIAGHTTVRDNNGFYYTYHVIPEYPAIIILPLFMLLALISIAFAKKYQFKKPSKTA